MKKSEAAQILAWCAAFDQRTIGDADVLAWHEALSSPWVPNLGLEEAQVAVTAHYQGTSERITPAAILKRVKDTRALAMSRALPKAEGVPPSEDYLQARAELDARVAESRRERHAAQNAEQDGGAA